MIAAIQKSGTSELWKFEIEGVTSKQHERGTADRIGWLRVALQLDLHLKGEWKISLT